MIALQYANHGLTTGVRPRKGRDKPGRISRTVGPFVRYGLGGMRTFSNLFSIGRVSVDRARVVPEFSITVKDRPRHAARVLSSASVVRVY